MHIKQVIFTRAASGDLTTFMEVLFTSLCFYITLRSMFISSLGGGGEFKKFSKIQLLFLACFSYLVVDCMRFYFFHLFVLCPIRVEVVPSEWF